MPKTAADIDPMRLLEWLVIREVMEPANPVWKNDVCSALSFLPAVGNKYLAKDNYILCSQ